MNLSREQVIELLRDDKNYYGGIGREYYSASDIGKILENEYTKEIDTTFRLPLEMGKLLHTKILEPEKVSEFDIYPGTRRDAKYKAMHPKDEEGNWITGQLTAGDEFKVDMMVDSINAHVEARGFLYGPGVEYEEPSVCEIEGLPFKGKADAINHRLGVLVDVKTTGGFTSFQESTFKWGYNSQAWIYWMLFKMPTVYVVVNKQTYETTVYAYDGPLYKKYYESGKERVMEAIEIIKSW